MFVPMLIMRLMPTGFFFILTCGPHLPLQTFPYKFPAHPVPPLRGQTQRSTPLTIEHVTQGNRNSSGTSAPVQRNSKSESAGRDAQRSSKDQMPTHLFKWPRSRTDSPKAIEMWGNRNPHSLWMGRQMMQLL